MILDRLNVDHLRLFESTTLQLDSPFLLITGANGSGKTTLLEAVHLLVRGRSFRRGGLDALIQYGVQSLRVQGRFQASGSALKLSLTKSRGDLVSMQLNGDKVRRVSDVATQIPIHTFTPDVAEFILGAPEHRRRWLDQGLVYAQPGALKAISHFRHVLRQRNSALKRGQSTDLQVWDFELGASGSRLSELRSSYFTQLQPFVNRAREFLCPNLSIEAQFEAGYTDTDYSDYLVKMRARDVKLGQTLGGPHRADIQINLGATDTQQRSLPAAATQVSRGQARSLAVAFMLGQVFYLKSREQVSLLLVDDLGSEMDDSHTGRFLQLIEESGCQTLATAVQSSEIIQKHTTADGSRIQLEAGKMV